MRIGKYTYRNLSILFFSFLTISELVLIGKSLTWLHLFLSITWLILIIIESNFIIDHLRNDILSRKYRLIYFGIVAFIIFANYFMLLYPLSPYIDSTDIITSFLPTFIGGMAGLTCATVFVSKDIETHHRTGKSFWQLRDSSVKHQERIFVLELFGFFPFMLFVGIPLAGILFNLLKLWNIPDDIRTFVALVPPMGLMGIWIIVVIRTGEKIKQNMNRIINSSTK
ncbi:MAG: hypothetical protein ACTSR2_08625 [Candidatus Hodarchaeales archaeon]